MGNSVERIEQAAGLLKRIQAACVVAEDKVRLADVAQRLSLQESQPGIGPDARRRLEGLQRDIAVESKPITQTASSRRCTVTTSAAGVTGNPASLAQDSRSPIQ